MEKKLKSKHPIFAYVLLAVLLFYFLSLLVPLLWAIFTSLKDTIELEIDKVWPSLTMTFENYINAFEGFSMDISHVDSATGITYVEPIKFGGMMLNSVVYAVGSSFIQTAIICVTAYATSRFNFKFDKVIYTIVIVTMILPIIGSLPSELRMAKLLQLYDSIWGMFLMKANFLGMYYLVFHAMFRGIPKDFDEAAYMDGAGNFTIFFKIVFPLIIGTFITVMLIKFIDFWNDYTTPMVYMPSFPTISLGLFNLVSGTKNGTASTQGELAASMIVFIPNFTIFIIFRDKLIGNISMGGLKE
jgi:ABC-type glycerol-3-phosphate transport system permease component